MREKFGRENRLSLPRIQKIVVSMGVGSAMTDKKHIEEAVAAMTEITGQKPLVCKSRKSIANFRLREGVAIGCKVTLRGARMYEFLDRLISIALPRVRDFRGLKPNAFDGHGNYSLGLTEQLVFPELNPDKYLRAPGHEHCDLLLGGLGRRVARDAADVRRAVQERGRSGGVEKLETRRPEAVRTTEFSNEQVLATMKAVDRGPHSLRSQPQAFRE